MGSWPSSSNASFSVSKVTSFAEQHKSAAMTAWRRDGVTHTVDTNPMLVSLGNFREVANLKALFMLYALIQTITYLAMPSFEIAH